MPFGVSSGIPNVIIHAKFHVDQLRGFWAAGPPKVPFPILIGTTLTTVLHYRADCDAFDIQQCRRRHCVLGLSIHPVCSFICQFIHSSIRLFIHLLVRLSRQIWLPWRLMNNLNNLDETYREYSLAPTDDLIRSGDQRSRSQQAVEVAKTYSSMLGRGSPSALLSCMQQ